MAHELEPKHFDKRTASRYLSRGIVSEKDWEKHLKALKDVADNMTKIETQQPDEFTPADG